MTMTCNRPFGHLPHETTQGTCDGLLHPDRDTRCPHPGCDHHAATPDRAHALPVGLVDHLTLLGSDHGPALVLEASAALWPTLAAAGESAAYDRGMLDASTALGAAVIEGEQSLAAPLSLLRKACHTFAVRMADQEGAEVFSGGQLLEYLVAAIYAQEEPRG